MPAALAVIDGRRGEFGGDKVSEAESADKTTKGHRTRAKILQAALELFKENGYTDTTMRAVAKRAGVSVGNAYYYFDSKEHLVQGFYDLTHEEHLVRCREILDTETQFKERLRKVLAAKIETAQPYHALSAILFRTAADPKSPLNPFSEESTEVRDKATELMKEVLEGSDAKVPSDLRLAMPNLLWLYEMAIILFWIHDRSEASARTQKLIRHTADLVAKLVAVASFPLMKPIRVSTLRLVQELTSH